MIEFSAKKLFIVGIITIKNSYNPTKIEEASA